LIDLRQKQSVFTTDGLLVFLLLLAVIYAIGTLAFVDTDFGDFFNVIGFVSDRNPYVDASTTGNISNYPPLAYLYVYLFYLFADIGGNPVMGNLFGDVSCALFLIIPLLLYIAVLQIAFNNKRLTLVGTVLLLVSWPTFFVLIRANINIAILPLILLFLIGYRSTNPLYRKIALLAICIAGAMKLYPILFCALYLREKDWTSIAKAIVIFLSLIVLPFLFFKGGLSNISLFINSILDFSSYELSYYNPNDVSIAGIFRTIAVAIGLDQALLKTVGMCVSVILALMLLLSALKCKTDYISILLITIIVIALPSPNYMYAMIFSYPALILAIKYFMENRDYTALFPFIVLMPVMLINQFYGQMGDCIIVCVLYVVSLIYLYMLFVRSNIKRQYSFSIIAEIFTIFVLCVFMATGSPEYGLQIGYAMPLVIIGIQCMLMTKRDYKTHIIENPS